MGAVDLFNLSGDLPQAAGAPTEVLLKVPVQGAEGGGTPIWIMNKGKSATPFHLMMQDPFGETFKNLYVQWLFGSR